MLLVIDIGNTNVCVGGFQGTELVFEFRLKTDTDKTVDELTAILDSLFSRRLGSGYAFERAIISSVVPPLTPDYARLCQDMLGLQALIVGPGVKTGVALNVQEPQAVGADRVVNAVAVKALFGCPGLVVDFGTATSFDLVGREGHFEGGIIAPGLLGSLDSLVRNTAKLPRIELGWPKSVIGKTTVTAMQAGALVGYVCLVDGLIDRIASEAGPIPHIIATGGLGRVVAAHSVRITAYDPHLTLQGLRLISEMNSK